MIEILALRPGERFLDVACGTGDLALLAAGRGAEVVGLDISADQLEKARAAAADAGLAIRFDEGDAQKLPYPDASFDVVASTFGMIFASDQARTARELTRVSRPQGRLGFTAWPEDDWSRLSARLRPEEFASADPRRWVDESYVRELLPEFELTFERGPWAIEAPSAEELWELVASSVPPLKAWLETIDDAGREAARREYLPLFAGGRLQRDYTLAVGTRR